MKKIMKKSLLFLAMAVLTLAMCTMGASAASVTVKAQKFTTSTATAAKKAKRVGIGTTKLAKIGSASEPGGYVKFTAPKTAKYSFTISKPHCLKTSYSDILNGHAYIMTTYGNGSYITMAKVSTKGGKATSLYLCSPYSYSLHSNDAATAYTALPSRTAKIKLQKGQTVYVYLWFTSQAYATLKIK